MSKTLKFKSIIVIICIYFLVFQNLLQKYIPFMQYFDEFISLLSIPVALNYLVKNKRFCVRKFNLYIIVAFLGLILIGLYSSVKYSYQSINMVLSDILLISKFVLAYFLSELSFNSNYVNQSSKRISFHIKLMISTLFILTILNYLFDIWPQSYYRFGIMANQLFFSHPTFLVGTCVFLLALLILSSNNVNKYVLMILFVMLSTLRVKAIGAIIIIVFIIIYINLRHKKISISKFGVFAILLVAFVWNQFSYYYIELDGSARKVLNETSLKIACDYFPLGSGFATFGSHFSMVEYSPIYSMYRINNVWGLMNGGTSFVSDTFWPMILGQFGFLGLILYLLIVLMIFWKIQNNFNSVNINVYISQIISIVYLIISSTSESAFVNPIAIPLALIIGINNYK